MKQECIGCEDCFPTNECPTARRRCGHHCNCLEIHDKCCDCGACINVRGEVIPGE